MIMPHTKSGKREINHHSPITESKTNRNRITAALLAIFFGSFGLHKFYLGKVIWGLVYLFFFWSLISTILGVIEGITYLLMSNQEFEKKYS